jgi:hypothetical protein
VPLDELLLEVAAILEAVGLEEARLHEHHETPRRSLHDAVVGRAVVDRNMRVGS